MPDIEIEIDGKPLQAKPNSMIIQVADDAGIYIPRFCYHKHLSIAANCRMCLVEVEKSPKALPACATPVMPGMKVFTRSAKAMAAQKAVMEFLLINHPLDCPICDQGGECELQDLSMGYGSADSFYNQGKRSVKDKDIGPLIATDMTRCIQCTRCVRFGDEIAGLRELGATGRGEHMEIGTYVQHAMHSEVSGNIIDICPVGALTSKPFRFTARAWELEQAPAIAPHDCLGANIHVHTRFGKVMRVVPRENNAINETWIADRDRYSYQGLYHPERLAGPQILIENIWRETDWQTAFLHIAKRLQQVIESHGADAIAGLASPHSTVEEFFLLQKLLRKLGSPHIDHRLRQVDFRDEEDFPLYPGLGFAISDLEQFDRILLIGSNIQKEQPSAGLRVRKAVLKGATVSAINVMDHRFHFNLAHKKIIAPHQLVSALASIAKVLVPTHKQLTNITVTQQDEQMAEHFRAGHHPTILLGAAAENHPEASALRGLAQLIANETGAKLGLLTAGSNAAGAWLAGAVPHRQPGGSTAIKLGQNAKDLFDKPKRAYVLMNVEPSLDCADPVAAVNALEPADFVLALSMFKDPILEQTANVILPMAPFTETSGTFVNAAGTWQSFKGTATPFGGSRPAWKILRVLGNFLKLEGFDYDSTEMVLADLKSLIPAGEIRASHYSPPKTFDFEKRPVLSRIGEIPLYATDSIVRRAGALQQAQTIIEGESALVRMHPKTAAQFSIRAGEIIKVKQQDEVIVLPVLFDDRVSEGALFIAGGTLIASGLRELFGTIEVVS